MKYKNILIVRTDRIGDVVLTLPLIQVLRKNYPDARITFLVRSYTKDVVEGQPDLDEVILYDEEGSRKRFFAMAFELRRSNFDLAIVAFPRFRVALLLLLAGVTTTVGSGYRWYSFLFTDRVLEHRKTAQKHEFEFNLSLARKIGCLIGPEDIPYLMVQERAREAAIQERKRLGLSTKDGLVILHPGSGGSARDWSATNFGTLAGRLADLGWKVVVTGATGEEGLVNQVIKESGNRAYSSVGRMSLAQLVAFIAFADLLAANSSGPLHIAAALGIPVIGFFPPIVACSVERWGPVTQKKVVFVPDRTKCPLCKGDVCRSNVCMDQISVEQVVDALRQLVGRKKVSKKPRNVLVNS